MNGVGGGGRDVWRGENKKGLEATSSGDCCGKENWKAWGKKRSEHANPVARQKGDTFVQLASNWKMNPPTLLTYSGHLGYGRNRNFDVKPPFYETPSVIINWVNFRTMYI